MAWTTHFAEIYPHIALQDRGTLELVARLKFKFHRGASATRMQPEEPAEVDAIEVVSLHMDFGGDKLEPLPLTSGLCDWIGETVDKDALIEKASADLVERDARAEMIAFDEWKDRRHERIIGGLLAKVAESASMLFVFAVLAAWWQVTP